MCYYLIIIQEHGESLGMTVRARNKAEAMVLGLMRAQNENISVFGIYVAHTIR